MSAALPVPHQIAGWRADPTKLLTVITVIVSLLVALVVPAGYFVDEYLELEDHLAAEAMLVAERLGELAREHPDIWRDSSRLDPVLARPGLYEMEARRTLVDRDGRVIGAAGDDQPWPVQRGNSTVYDSGGAPVASVMLESSWTELLEETAAVALASAILGLAIFLAAFTWPLRALRRAIGELQISARTIENTADSVIIYDDRWRILTVNRAFVAVTGYEPQEVVGKTPEWLRSSEHGVEFYDAMRREVLANGRWRGEMVRRRKDGTIYPTLCSISAVRNDAGAVTNYVTVFNDVSSSKEYEKKLQFLAHYDSLTELPNRTLFMVKLGEALTRARRNGKHVAVLFADLDQFKTVNDSMGHDAGDALLRAMGRRLHDCLRESDTAARQGGDEFTVLLEELERTEDASQAAERVIAALAEPVQIVGHEIAISGSIGISCYPSDGEDAETLLKNADSAMYRAKELGRNNYQFFSADMNVLAAETLLLRNGLRLALQRSEFVLHYQPRYALASGKITGLEALVRWQHPEQGLVPPGKFIPLAEDTGMIVQLGEWVMRAACMQMKEWQRLGLTELYMAVNVSPRQFRLGQLTERIGAILRETGLPAEYLEIEITEGVLMHDHKASESVLREIRAMGVSIAIDDFGAGYSSLSYLKRFPVDYLKIDRAFVSNAHEDPADMAIVRTIIELAKGLNLRTIAEGVELDEHRNILKLLGCDHAQGFLLSRPLPAHEIERLLSVNAGAAAAAQAAWNR